MAREQELQTRLLQELHGRQAQRPEHERDWRVPYPQDPRFIGRAPELKALAKACKENVRVVLNERIPKQVDPAVVFGWGGVGKTSLANAFVHRYGQRFEGGV